MDQVKCIKMMAELVYLEKPVKKDDKDVAFKDLPEAKKKDMYAVAQKIFDNLDRMNLRAVPKLPEKSAQAANDERNLVFGEIETVINEWIKGIESPKELVKAIRAKYVPFGELAKRIQNWYESKTKV